MVKTVMREFVPFLPDHLDHIRMLLHHVSRHEPGRLQIIIPKNIQNACGAALRTEQTDGASFDVLTSVRQLYGFIAPNRIAVQIK